MTKATLEAVFADELSRLPAAAYMRPVFSYLREIRRAGDGVGDQNRASWNPLLRWLRWVDELRPAA